LPVSQPKKPALPRLASGVLCELADVQRAAFCSRKSLPARSSDRQLDEERGAIGASPGSTHLCVG
jgi:hypothetical protein